MRDKNKMIEEMRRHIAPLTDVMSKAIINYIKENFEGEVHVDFILNLLTSTHMSSLANLMRYTVQDEPEALKNVEIMLERIAKTLGASIMSRGERKEAH